MTNDGIEIDNAPVIPELVFRHFRDPSDFPHMATALNASGEADQAEVAVRIDDVANTYAHLNNCDPYQDMIIAETHNISFIASHSSF